MPHIWARSSAKLLRVRLFPLRRCNLCFLLTPLQHALQAVWHLRGCRRWWHRTLSTASPARPTAAQARPGRYPAPPGLQSGLRGLPPPASRLQRLASGPPHLPPSSSCLPPASFPPAAPARLPTCCRLGGCLLLPAVRCTDMAFYSPFKLMVLCALLQAAAAEGAVCRCVYARLLELYSTTS